jgi:hypothetical protein
MRAIVTAPNLAPTGLTPQMPVSKKSFANALDERILPNQAVAGKRAVAVGYGLKHGNPLRPRVSRWVDQLHPDCRFGEPRR